MLYLRGKNRQTKGNTDKKNAIAIAPANKK
jgi:hypothetical protein